jgi:uncharacterized membrane protein
MRSDRKKNKVKFVSILLAIVIVVYNIGYWNGQQSIYKKAENDHKLLEMYGGNGK